MVDERNQSTPPPFFPYVSRGTRKRGETKSTTREEIARQTALAAEIDEMDSVETNLDDLICLSQNILKELTENQENLKYPLPKKILL